MIQKPHFTRRAHGQSMVEFAVSITVLFILIAGIVDLSRLAFYYMSMQDAAQEGAVYGVAYPTHCDQIEDRVRSAMTGDTSVNITVKVNGVACQSASLATDACSGKELSVEVTQPNFPVTMPFLGTFLGKQNLSMTTIQKDTILRPLCSGGS